MEKAELYLKTIFCCVACDGEIAKEEIAMIKDLTSGNDIFSELDTEQLINRWIAAINDDGAAFLKNFLNELSAESLSIDEQLLIIGFALEAIEADNCIEYSEIKFFKKIRARLPVSDEEILKLYPEKEDFLLPDLNAGELPEWDSNIKFNDISFS